MKKLMLMALTAMFALSVNAQEPQKKQCCKKEKTECGQKKDCNGKSCAKCAKSSAETKCDKKDKKGNTCGKAQKKQCCKKSSDKTCEKK